MRRHLSVVLVALLIVACVGETGPTGPQGSRGTAGLDGRDGQDGRPGPAGPAGEPLNWADVLEEHRVNEATYVLLYTYTHRDGKRYYDMFCTGFAAYYTSVVWTNAHCVDAALERARELRGADPHFFIVRAETPIGGDQTYAIDLDQYWKHPDYDNTTRSEDVGLLDIDGVLPTLLNLLPRRFTDNLSVGQPIGTLGFPGELNATGGAGRMTTPTFKNGVVSALRLIDSGEGPHVEIQYNFDTSGGTSGSPVFDHDGWLVAVNHATIANGKALNFGIHIDAVWDYIDILEAGRTVTAQMILDDAPVLRTYPHDTYRPFPENWNGETITPD